VIAPLLARTTRWGLSRPPHLVLVPLGELAAVPFAAAWTPDPAAADGRRHAIEDFEISYSASARLLIDAAGRRRPGPGSRPVLLVDPTGQFPYSRRTARALVERFYPNAHWYGRRAPDGAASTERTLEALVPADDLATGAPVVQLFTHGRMLPTPAVQTQDGWLSLSDVVDRGRRRSPDTGCGLVVTTACLTDATRSHVDESVTLAAALQAAGAAGVVGTRWPVDDPAAAALTYRLHHHLDAGRPPAAALRLAQLDLVRARTRRPDLPPRLADLPADLLADPAAWAGFVQHGG
jgi:CHAT domain-containing protein